MVGGDAPTADISDVGLPTRIDLEVEAARDSSLARPQCSASPEIRACALCERSSGSEAVGEELAELGRGEFDVFLRAGVHFGDERHLGVDHEESL